MLGAFQCVWEREMEAVSVVFRWNREKTVPFAQFITSLVGVLGGRSVSRPVAVPPFHTSKLSPW